MYYAYVHYFSEEAKSAQNLNKVKDNNLLKEKLAKYDYTAKPYIIKPQQVENFYST